MGILCDILRDTLLFPPKLGFPWILWSELSFFNGLRAIFSGNIFLPLPGRQSDDRRPCRGVRFAVHAAFSVRRPDISGIDHKHSVLQSERGRLPTSKPFHHEAAACFRQDNVGNSNSRTYGHGVKGATDLKMLSLWHFNRVSEGSIVDFNKQI